jgi:hypothetical protein
MLTERRRVVIVIGLLTISLAGAWAYAQQASQARPAAITGQDLAEIQQLFSRYNQGTDFQDAALFVSAFSTDAEFTLGNGRKYVGEKSLTEYKNAQIAAAPNGRKSRHYNSSLVVTPTPEGAKGRGYYMVVDISGKPVPSSSGYYDDTYVRTRDGWRIKTRVLHSDAAASGQ